MKWPEHEYLSGDDIILLTPGQTVRVESYCSVGWLTGECVVNEKEEIKCLHGWMSKDYFLKNPQSHRMQLL